MLQKSKPIRIQALRDMAKGCECTFRIPNVCNYNSETSVLCHLPDESHGMARKSDDVSVAVGCSSCHDAIDGRSGGRYFILSELDKEFYMRRAMIRTWRKAIELGIIKV